jgi:dienelactone hydrolase
MAKLFKVAALFGCLALLPGFASVNVTFPSLAIFPDAQTVTLQALLTRPEGAGKHPALVLLPACGGISQPLTKTWPEYFASLGYVTLAVNSIGARKLSNCATLLRDKAARDSAAGDAHGALDYLVHLDFVDPNNIAVMGFSWGAIMITYISARDIKTPDGVTFKAAVSFYGHCSLGPAEAATYSGTPRYPWLIVNGGNERPVMIDSCRKIQDKPSVTFKVIDGAYHAWDNPAFRTIRNDFAGNPMLYSAGATDQSKQIVKAFLTTQFGK